MNQSVAVGRIKSIGEDVFTISVTHLDDGPYTIPCKASADMMKHIKDYCKIGHLIGIKGYLKSEPDTLQVYLWADKVTFLSSDMKGGD